MKDILTAPWMVEMIRTVTNMYDHGRNERNGGNVSLLLEEPQVAPEVNLGLVRLTNGAASLGLCRRQQIHLRVHGPHDEPRRAFEGRSDLISRRCNSAEKCVA